MAIRRARKTKRTTRRIVRRKRSMFRITKQNNIIRYVNLSEIVGKSGDSSFGTTINLNNVGLLTLTTAAVQGMHYFTIGMGFALEDIPKLVDVVDFYQQYKFMGVKIKLIPISNVSATQTPGAAESAAGGFLHYAWDTNDALAPTPSVAGLAELRQYQSYKMKRLTSIVNVNSNKNTHPLKIAGSVYGGITDAYSVISPVWLNSATTDCLHYGFKCFWEVVNPSATVINLNFKIEVAYLLALRETQ